jgi:hypothetical protein
VITNATSKRIEVCTFKKQANLSLTQTAALFTILVNCVADAFTQGTVKTKYLSLEMCINVLIKIRLYLIFIEVKQTNGRLCVWFSLSFSLYERVVLLCPVILRRKQRSAGLTGKLCVFGH